MESEIVEYKKIKSCSTAQCTLPANFAPNVIKLGQFFAILTSGSARDGRIAMWARAVANRMRGKNCFRQS